MAQRVGALVTAVVWVQSLAWKLPHGAGITTTTKKKAKGRYSPCVVWQDLPLCRKTTVCPVRGGKRGDPSLGNFEKFSWKRGHFSKAILQAEKGPRHARQRPEQSLRGMSR